MKASLRLVTPIAALALALLPALQPADAAVIASYSAGTTAPAPDPTTQSWTVSGNLAVTPKAGTETINGKTYQYWDISNGAAGDPSGFSALYRQNIAASTFTDPAGWTASVKLRVERADNAFNAAFLQVSDGKSSWEVNFVNNPTNGSSINYHGASTPLVQLSTQDTAADYLTVQLYYDPANSSVSFFLNGTQLGSAITRSNVPTATSSQLYVRWGDNSGGPTTVRTISHWNSVEFETGYAVIPEPQPVGLVAAGGLLLLAMRHRWSGNR